MLMLSICDNVCLLLKILHLKVQENELIEQQNKSNVCRCLLDASVYVITQYILMLKLSVYPLMCLEDNYIILNQQHY